MRVASVFPLLQLDIPIRFMFLDNDKFLLLTLYVHVIQIDPIHRRRFEKT
jgi:hypothetical protein